MAGLASRYLGLDLASPLVASASPLSRSLDNFERLERAGAGAIVMFSLFEEQIRRERYRFRRLRTAGLEERPQQLETAPAEREFAVDPEAYLRHFERAAAAVEVPVIPSLNGLTLGGWTRFAHQLEAAGAPALELNLYLVAADPRISGGEVEDGLIEIVRAVRETVRIPIAVKLAPYFSSFAHFAQRVVDAGADGLVLFNRFYQPDVDLESRSVDPRPLLSTASDLRLPLRWIANLRGRLDASLAASGGVHSGDDALRAIAAGADAVMTCSALLRFGIEALARMQAEMVDWLDRHDCGGLDDVRGVMSLESCPDSAAFERAHYIRAILGG